MFVKTIQFNTKMIEIWNQYRSWFKALIEPSSNLHYIFVIFKFQNSGYAAEIDNLYIPALTDDDLVAFLNKKRR